MEETMTEENDRKYYFNGIRVDGEYGVKPMNPEALVDKLNEDEQARFEESENLKASLSQASKLFEGVAKILFDLNQQTLAGELTTQDAWLEALAHKLSVLILGEVNTKPGNVMAFAQHLKAAPWDVMQDIIDYLTRAGNEKALARFLLSISSEDEGARKEFLKAIADHTLDEIGKEHLCPDLAPTLAQDRDARGRWLASWIGELRSLQIDSLKLLSDVKGVMTEPLETLIRALMHPPLKIACPGPWLNTLVKDVRASDEQARTKGGDQDQIRYRQTQGLKQIFSELSLPEAATPTSTCWLETLLKTLTELYLRGDSTPWYTFLDRLYSHFEPLRGEIGDTISWEGLLVALTRWLTDANVISEIPSATLRGKVAHLGTADWVDPKDLRQTGWGIIFPQFMPEEQVAKIKAALDPLLRHRLIQTDLARLDLNEDLATLYGKSLDELVALREEETTWFPNWRRLFWIYDRSLGYRPGDTARAFMKREPRHADPSRPVDPQQGNVPYYLLVVGSPEDIPFEFLYGMDVQFSVGRIDFGDDYDAYRRYAENVVATERGMVTPSANITFFAAQNPGDRATELSLNYLAQPLCENLRKRHLDGTWYFNLIAKQEATKAHLLQMLGGEACPALLFTTSHGLEFDHSKPEQCARQRTEQGALICSDWPEGESKVVKPEHYVSGKDVRDANPNVRGMIAFFFACYGAGTPLYDEYSRQRFKTKGEPIAEHPFVADLPKALLGLKNGALAVVGHIERAWGTSFLGDDIPRAEVLKARSAEHIAVFESALERLLDGHPIGSAMDYFNTRYAALATELTALQEPFSNASDYELAHIWTAHNDARGYVVIGDPAVRLSVTENKTTEN
jgi:hypothetical protein